MNNISLYTYDNIIGQSIYDYMIDNQKDITIFRYQDIIQGTMFPLHGIVIFNVIHREMTVAETISLLNKMRSRLLRCSRLVLVVKSDTARLCLELIEIDNISILTEKSSRSDFYRIASVPTDESSFALEKKLSIRERQVLQLIVACYSNRRIATLLNIDHKTVHSHRIHIMKKLGIDNSRAMYRGIIGLHQC